MDTKVRRLYTTQTKQDAVGQVLQAGLNPVQVARTYEMPIQTLHNWVRIARQSNKTAEPNKLGSARSVDDTQALISKLKADCARLTMERDILKKATAYFARDLL